MNLESIYQSLNSKGATYEYIQDKGYTPLILITVEGTEGYNSKTQLIYGHLGTYFPNIKR